MYTDSDPAAPDSYSIFPGLNWVKGIISPHYDRRALDFDQKLLYNKQAAVGLEDKSAIELVNGEIVRSFSWGGNAYAIRCEEGTLCKSVIQPNIAL